MKAFVVAVCFAASLSVAFAGVSPAVRALSSVGAPDDLPPWDRMDVTWAKFSGIPLTSSDAASQGWTLSGGCSDNSSWAGNRYLLNGDISTAPIYDSKGNLAGFQFGIYTQPPSAWLGQIWETQTKFSPSGATYYTLTTYFMDPSIICNSPYSSEQPLMRPVSGRVGAIGDRLFLKRGNVYPTDYVALPLAEADAPNSGWVKGKCFISMGIHYWYNLSPSMSCDEIFPIFVIYNKGVLTTYGAITGVGAVQNQTSSRWEHPGGSQLKLFLPDGGAPACLFAAGPLSTQHVFLTNPLFDFC